MSDSQGAFQTQQRNQFLFWVCQRCSVFDAHVPSVTVKLHPTHRKWDSKLTTVTLTPNSATTSQLRNSFSLFSHLAFLSKAFTVKLAAFPDMEMSHKKANLFWVSFICKVSLFLISAKCTSRSYLELS